MEERVFFDEMIEESDDTEEFQGMYQDEIEQEAVNSEDLGEQEFQAIFDGNDFLHEVDELYRIEDIENIAMVDFLNIGAHEMECFHFPNLQIAFDFYNHYTKSVGFGARKIRFVAYTGRWHVALFVESYNHDCLDPRLVGFLPTHKKMAKADASQMNNMKDAGISTPHIYAMLANQAGGYENKSEDTNLYYEHIVDAKRVLRALFWCDGRSQLDYEVFGDVLAFDATYKKNKYLCPVVVFSGVNHHNQIVVFGSALVTDESKEVYVWLLQQLLAAMKGKAPVSVITDGAPSMRFVIETVFPNAHHRLCAWHLIRNATSNVGNPKFTSMFKKCMLGDYEISVFEQKLFGMVEEFGVVKKNWIIDMYEKRHMWATAHIRGKFFAGFRTTSRCEDIRRLKLTMFPYLVFQYLKQH
ncbi:protein FAR1-RELATED SEQUENCE 5-like [Arachis ipaensis]|uniref:protein FAR1-RELATED SEQUENCE 5-like n=1 Tax=Arachis ipaensis TaxID=130454 RepID=UPI000A2B2184|nr:protein FAR1-RELATED SEQUENCE 5-like [Arachis ipaensis]